MRRMLYIAMYNQWILTAIVRRKKRPGRQMTVSRQYGTHSLHSLSHSLLSLTLFSLSPSLSLLSVQSINDVYTLCQFNQLTDQLKEHSAIVYGCLTTLNIDTDTQSTISYRWYEIMYTIMYYVDFKTCASCAMQQ